MIASGRAALRPGMVVCGWVLIVVAAALWGHSIPTRHLHLGDAPPLIGRLRVHRRTWTLLPAAIIALMIATTGVRVAATMRWRPLLVVAWMSSAAWAIALAASDGWRRVSEPLTRRFEYLAVVPRIGSHPLEFLQRFTNDLPTYPTHVKGHGPLAPLTFWLLTRLGLPQPASSAALAIAVGAGGTVAVAITVRLLADEQAARRMLPFLVLLPGALWIATSADAIFLGTSAWGVALLALAGTRRDPAGDALAVSAGTLIAVGLLMSYGLLVLLALPPAIAKCQRRVRPILVAAAAAILMFGILALLGFNYLGGFKATHAAWAAGWGPQRSRAYFLLANVASLAILVGPAVAGAFATFTDRRLRLLLTASVIAVAASDLSGFVRGEAERIWLPFAPWLTVATASTHWSRRTTTLALLSQAVLAISIQAVVRSPW